MGQSAQRDGHEPQQGRLSLLAHDDELLRPLRLTAVWTARPDADVDARVLLLGPDGRVRSDDDLVVDDQPEAEDGAVRLLG